MVGNGQGLCIFTPASSTLHPTFLCSYFYLIVPNLMNLNSSRIHSRETRWMIVRAHKAFVVLLQGQKEAAAAVAPWM